MIHEYNKVMGRVDQLDQNVMRYMTQHMQQEMVVIDTPILLWISAAQSASCSLVTTLDHLGFWHEISAIFLS